MYVYMISPKEEMVVVVVVGNEDGERATGPRRWQRRKKAKARLSLVWQREGTDL